MNVILHKISEDGLPDMETLCGRVAFIFDGCVVSGWPLICNEDGEQMWEADSDVGRTGKFAGVEYWLEFAEPVWDFAPTSTRLA